MKILNKLHNNKTNNEGAHMEQKNLEELDKKELERIINIAKIHKNDEKIDINIFYKDRVLDLCK